MAAVELDPFQTIVNVHWDSEPAVRVAVIQFFYSFGGSNIIGSQPEPNWDADIDMQFAGGDNHTVDNPFGTVELPPDLHGSRIYSYAPYYNLEEEIIDQSITVTDRALYNITVDGVLYTYLEDALGAQLVPFIIDYAEDPPRANPPTQAILPADEFSWVETIRNNTSPGAPYTVHEIEILDSHVVEQFRKEKNEVLNAVIFLNLDTLREELEQEPPGVENPLRIVFSMESATAQEAIDWGIRVAIYEDVSSFPVDSFNNAEWDSNQAVSFVEFASNQIVETPYPAQVRRVDIDLVNLIVTVA